jgi:hypothetical protein
VLLLEAAIVRSRRANDVENPPSLPGRHRLALGQTRLSRLCFAPERAPQGISLLCGRQEQLLQSLREEREEDYDPRNLPSEVIMSKSGESLEGGCACGTHRYALSASPLIVHCCHCLDCQRITGSAFVINVWIERRFVEVGSPAPKSFRLAGGTGRHHDVFYCDRCGTTLWSRYEIAPGDALFVRAGTLDTPGAVRPDVHIFTRSKVPWLELPAGVRAFKDAYQIEEVWSTESKERLRRNLSETT